MAVLGQQRVGLEGVDQPAEQVRDLAARRATARGTRGARRSARAAAPARRSRSICSAIVRSSGARARRSASAPRRRAPARRRPRRCTSAWPSRRASSHTCACRRPDIRHDLDVGPQARLDRAHALERERALAVVQQRGAAAEQRAVEVEVDGSGRRQRCCAAAARSVIGGPLDERHVAVDQARRSSRKRGAVDRHQPAFALAAASRDRREHRVAPSGRAAPSGWWRFWCSSRSTCAMPVEADGAVRRRCSIAISTP